MSRASPALLASIRETAMRLRPLLDEAARFSGEIRDARLGVEVAVIHRLAERLTGWLMTRDPLSERVHLSKPQALAVAARAAGGEAMRRVLKPRARPVMPGGAS